MVTGYQQIKLLAKRSGLNIPELLTLHRAEEAARSNRR
jgi:hypothetical protein